MWIHTICIQSRMNDKRLLIHCLKFSLKNNPNISEQVAADDNNHYHIQMIFVFIPCISIVNNNFSRRNL